MMIAVAAYCRVSTDQRDQANSFASQQRYFREQIAREQGWELYAIYADEGISGTSTRKRSEFLRMIEDARKGRFQLILTKEVSRFSRNILDTIYYTRELKALGVGVLFVGDGIHTLEPDAELRLSIMASLAQEESRKISARVKWGQTRRMEQGVVFGSSMLGYCVKDGELTVDPVGARLVRRIFYQFVVEQKGITAIAKELQEEGYPTCRGGRAWTGSYIGKILKNEKYVGDLVQKKTYTPDYLTHIRRYNHGQEERIIVKDHHEAIIDRETWELAQEERERRNRNRNKVGGHARSYLFSGKIRCGECGGSFVSRKRTRSDGTTYRKWGCLAGGQGACSVGRMLRDEAAMDALRQSIKTLKLDTAAAMREVTDLASEAAEISENTQKQLQDRIRRLKRKREAVLTAYLEQMLTLEELQVAKNYISREEEEIQYQLQEIEKRNRASGISAEVMEIAQGNTNSVVFLRNILKQITVFRDGRIEVSLQGLPQKWIFVCEK